MLTFYILQVVGLKKEKSVMVKLLCPSAILAKDVHVRMALLHVESQFVTAQYLKLIKINVVHNVILLLLVGIKNFAILSLEVESVGYISVKHASVW